MLFELDLPDPGGPVRATIRLSPHRDPTMAGIFVTCPVSAASLARAAPRTASADRPRDHAARLIWARLSREAQNSSARPRAPCLPRSLTSPWSMVYACLPSP